MLLDQQCPPQHPACLQCPSSLSQWGHTGHSLPTHLRAGLPLQQLQLLLGSTAPAPLLGHAGDLSVQENIPSDPCATPGTGDLSPTNHPLPTPQGQMASPSTCCSACPLLMLSLPKKASKIRELQKAFSSDPCNNVTHAANCIPFPPWEGISKNSSPHPQLIKHGNTHKVFYKIKTIYFYK